MSFAATQMDLEIILLSEVSQTEKDKYHMVSLICETLKMIKWTYLLMQNTNRPTDVENNVIVTKGENRELGFRMT